MTNLNEIYKCEICGNIVNVFHAGAGQLVCCGQPMVLLVEKDSDLGNEKHVPIIEVNENESNQTNVLVKIGSVEHPMTQEHHIEWVELIADDKILKKQFKFDEKPTANFVLDFKPTVISARVYCNLHGLWKSKQ
ncbi:MAG: desulfoferrodoxin [Candidatus ainarchaeum sp.]|nr:desulfoferrodoxin [Candidatus ainarchaeum sp.]